MMGTREKLRGGNEWEALSRRSRRLVRFAPGIVQSVKRQFWKRVRKRAKMVSDTRGD